MTLAVLIFTMICVLASRANAMAQGGAKHATQLETPRVTQAAQRSEFGVEGPQSAFKFSFADPVRHLTVLPGHSSCEAYKEVTHLTFEHKFACTRVAVARVRIRPAGNLARPITCSRSRMYWRVRSAVRCGLACEPWPCVDSNRYTATSTAVARGRALFTAILQLPVTNSTSHVRLLSFRRIDKVCTDCGIEHLGAYA